MKRTLHIAEVVAVFPPAPGGTGYVCYHNAIELARRGHEVTVFTLGHHGTTPRNDPPGLEVVRLTTPLAFQGGGAVPQLISRLRPFDVIHLHYPFYGGAEYVWLAAILRGKRYLLTYHQDISADSPVKRTVLRIYERLFLGSILHRAARVGVLSDSHARSSDAAKHLDWSKVVEIPNGVDASLFQPREKDPDFIERYRLAGRTVALFVGHLLPFKGLPVLLKAMARMDGETMVLLTVGVGPYESEYRALAADLGIADRVVFAGYQDQTRGLPRFYNTCDFLVLPSIGAPESFGMVVIEAMASGKPAIVSALPGPRQLIEDGKDGLVAAAGDVQDLKQKLEWMSVKQEQREAMGRAGRRKVMERYSWERIGDRLEAVLYDIAGS